MLTSGPTFGAFGVVLYELLTGERLFMGDDVSEVLAAVIKDQPSLERAPSQNVTLAAELSRKRS